VTVPPTRPPWAPVSRSRHRWSRRDGDPAVSPALERVLVPSGVHQVVCDGPGEQRAEGREGGHRVIVWMTSHSPQEYDAMTAPSSLDSAHFLHEQLAQASPDLLRQMLTTFINTLMSAEADAVSGRGGRAPRRKPTRSSEWRSPGAAHGPRARARQAASHRWWPATESGSSPSCLRNCTRPWAARR
jgi:hypothetical protein